MLNISNILTNYGKWNICLFQDTMKCAVSFLILKKIEQMWVAGLEIWLVYYNLEILFPLCLQNFETGKKKFCVWINSLWNIF